MSWVKAAALARRYWWAVPMIGLAVALLMTRATLAGRTATLKAERTAWTAEIDRADRARLESERRFATNLAQAATDYASTISAMQPIIVRSTNTVREYAQTDAGRVLCRGADRVHAIDALDAELARDPAGAGGGTGAVPTNAAAPSAGR